MFPVLCVGRMLSDFQVAMVFLIPHLAPSAAVPRILVGDSEIAYPLESVERGLPAPTRAIAEKDPYLVTTVCDLGMGGQQ